MEAEDLLEEPYSFGKCYSKTCYVKAKCNAWDTPEHDIKVYIRRSGNFVEILLLELMFNTNKKENKKDIITLDLNLMDSELDKFLGKTRVGRQFSGAGINKEAPNSYLNVYRTCTFTLSRDGKIYIAPSDDCFGFTSIDTGASVGTYSLVLSFMADDSEPEITTPEAKKAAT